MPLPVPHLTANTSSATPADGHDHSLLVWAVARDNVLRFIERPYLGQADEALAELERMSRTPGFVLGQVLTRQGVVLENWAP